MPRGGARAGAGSAPALDTTISKLRRQIDWYVAASLDRRDEIALRLAAINLHIQLSRLMELLGIEPRELTDEERARAAAIVAAMEEE